MTYTNYYFIGYMVMAIFTFVMIEIGEKKMEEEIPLVMKYISSLLWFIILPAGIIKGIQRINSGKKDD